MALGCLRWMISDSDDDDDGGGGDGNGDSYSGDEFKGHQFILRWNKKEETRALS